MKEVRFSENRRKLRNFTRKSLFGGAGDDHPARLCGPRRVGQRFSAGLGSGHHAEQVVLVGVLDFDIDDVARLQRRRNVAQIDMAVDFGCVGL